MIQFNSHEQKYIRVQGAREHNLKNLNVDVDRGQITVVTGVSGSGKSSLAFDSILAEAQRRFFYTLSHYTRQFLDLGSRPAIGSVTGLSPAIALAQNETQPSVRATVGTLTDVSELFGVLFARFAEPHCPTHFMPTATVAIKTIIDRFMQSHEGKSLAIAVPIAEKKKGTFRKPLSRFAEKGYIRALIDGELVSLSPIPELDKDQKHDIRILVDIVKVEEKRRERLQRSLETALELGEGVGEYYLTDQRGKPMPHATIDKFSLANGCPECGFSWPKLDSRYFSVNSLGACHTCRGLGYLKIDEETAEEDPWHWHSRICRVCEGAGLKRELEAIRFFDLTPFKVLNQSISALKQSIFDIQKKFQASMNPACLRILVEIDSHLERMVKVGLGYLTLNRRIRSLSGGESQRLRLSGVLGENLRGVLYVLDEPSQGLSPKEIDTLWPSLYQLKESGNTILIVDHDENMMKRADWIIDLGPQGGRFGGNLMAKFKPNEADQYVDLSLTAKYLSLSSKGKIRKSTKKFRPSEWLVIVQPRLFNLKMDQVRIPVGGLTVVSGVSGAGKSTLILSILYQNLESLIPIAGRKPKFKFCQRIEGVNDIARVLLVNRKSIAKTSSSMPATYLDVFGDIRNLFAKLPEAQIAGLTNRSFSLSVEEGRCPECKGKGTLSLSMKFLSDAKITCPVCDGKRYQPHVLDVCYRNRSIADVLAMTIEEALEHLANHPKIVKKLQPACDLGLGYLKLGQPSTHLSGGESQRLKLAPLLSKQFGSDTILILDEPTRGLHFQDVELLINQLEKIRNQGATIVVIEHNQDLLDAADWLIVLGPGAADQGGNKIYEGIPSSFKGSL